ncbi:MAG: hypothetical protein WC455_20815 [Dehalococcoidia bacterium]|jgi:hypothetical protein
MKVIISETGTHRELSIIDRKTGCDWISDLVGNTGSIQSQGLAATQDKYITVDDNGIWHMDQGDYDWWDKYITDYQATEESKDSLRISLAHAGITQVDGREVDEIIFERTSEAAGNGDMEDEAGNVYAALREIAQEAGIKW